MPGGGRAAATDHAKGRSPFHGRTENQSGVQNDADHFAHGGQLQIPMRTHQETEWARIKLCMAQLLHEFLCDDGLGPWPLALARACRRRTAFGDPAPPWHLAEHVERISGTGCIGRWSRTRCISRARGEGNQIVEQGRLRCRSWRWSNLHSRITSRRTGSREALGTHLLHLHCLVHHLHLSLHVHLHLLHLLRVHLLVLLRVHHAAWHGSWRHTHARHCHLSRHHALHASHALHRHGHARHPRRGELALTHGVKDRKLFIGSTGKGIRGLTWWLHQRRLGHRRRPRRRPRPSREGRRFWRHSVRDCWLGRSVEAQVKIEESR